MRRRPARAKRRNYGEIMDETTMRRRKQLILWCGVVLFFFTSMSKVLVPGAVFNDLQALGFGAGAIASLGAWYMYTYAFSQMAVGIFSDRYGGVRLLLFGGGFFAAGSLLFPLGTAYPVLFAARVLAGMGSGTVYLGVSKLICDLYSERFALVFGTVLFLGYLGPITGVLPMAWLIQTVTWRWAMAVPAAFAVGSMLVITLSARGCIKPTVPGNCFAALWKLIRDRRNIALFLASSTVFGSYYALLTGAGYKCLEDVCGMTRMQSSTLLTAMAVLVSLENLLIAPLLKLCGGRRKAILLFALICALCASLLGAAAFHWRLPTYAAAAAFVLQAIPAGFFSLFAIIAKELNPPERSGLAVSTLNFCAFVMIALVSDVAGALLNRSTGAAKLVGKLVIYPPEAYRNIFILFAVVAVAGLVCGFGVPETRNDAGKR